MHPVGEGAEFGSLLLPKLVLLLVRLRDIQRIDLVRFESIN